MKVHGLRCDNCLEFSMSAVVPNAFFNLTVPVQQTKLQDGWLELRLSNNKVYHFHSWICAMRWLEAGGSAGEGLLNT